MLLRLAGLLSLSYFLCTNEAGASFDPTNPAGSGYVLVFDDEFTSISTIDVNNTKSPGFKWYVQYPFGSQAGQPGDFSITSGVLTMNPSVDTGWEMSTMLKVSTGNVLGQTFDNRCGGVYAEASISFDNTLVNTANGWPAFWSMSIEHLAGGTALAQWPGQTAGYDHFIEPDFFEYDTVGGSGANSFGSATHDWYGLYGVTCGQWCSVTNNGVVTLGATTWTNFHKVGWLWVPGSATTYFDGSATSAAITWTGQAITPPPSGTLTYSVLDVNHLAIVFGTGANQPLNVDYVHVWQLPCAPAVTHWFQ